MEPRRIAARLALTTLIVVLGGLAALVLMRGFHIKSLFGGFVFGASVSAANFWLLSRDISRTRYAERDYIERWLFARFLLRYALIAAGFGVCLFYPGLHILGFVTGFVVFQLAAFWSMFRFWQ